MADTQIPTVPNDSEIRRVWLKFCEDLEPLLIARKDNRLLDAFIILKNRAMDMVKNEKFILELEKVYQPQVSEPPHQFDALQALIIEMRAFSSAMEISKTIEEEDSKSWLQKYQSWFLSQSGIVIGSAKDLLNSSPILKNGLTVLGEVVEIFKVKM